MKLVYQIKIINDEGSLIRIFREIESLNLRFAGTGMMLLIADRIEQDGHLYPLSRFVMSVYMQKLPVLLNLGIQILW